MWSSYFSPGRVDVPDFRAALARQNVPPIQCEAGTSTSSLNDISCNAKEPYQKSVPSLPPLPSAHLASLGPETVGSKIAEVVEKITPEELVAEESLSNNEKEIETVVVASCNENKAVRSLTCCNNIHCTHSFPAHEVDLLPKTTNVTFEFQAEAPEFYRESVSDGIGVRTVNSNGEEMENPCSCCKGNSVEGLMTAGERGKFFSKIYCVKIMQLAMILGWLLLVSFNFSLCKKINRNYRIWLYIPFSIYIIFLVIIRFYPFKLPQTRGPLGFVLIIMTVCAALVLGGATSRLHSNIFAFTAIVLLCSSVFFATYPRYGMMDVLETGLLVCWNTLNITFITSVIFIVAKLYHSDQLAYDTPTLWLPVIVSSQLISLVVSLLVLATLKFWMFLQNII